MFGGMLNLAQSATTGIVCIYGHSAVQGQYASSCNAMWNDLTDSWSRQKMLQSTVLL